MTRGVFWPGEGLEGKKMRIVLSRVGALALVLASSACQRPTQILPAAPLFDYAGQASSEDVIPGPDVDALAVDGPLAGSVEDFLAHVGTDRILFAYDSDALTPEAKAILDRQTEWLLRYPVIKISLEGHADERGTREYNFALGERRAAAMRLYLMLRGVPAGRMSATSLGKERPLVAGSDEQSWAQNRRGETVLMGAKGQQ